MKIIRPGVFLALIALLALTAPGLSQPATISWPEAVAQLAGERAKAEACVALVKKYGDDAQIARGQLIYTSAKADSDAVIAGLIAALSTTGQSPPSLSSLQTKLSSGVSGLVEFCSMVRLPNTRDNVMIRLTEALAGRLLKMLSESVSALYNNHRTDDALIRRTIQNQLEASRWPAFSEVKAAQ